MRNLQEKTNNPSAPIPLLTIVVPCHNEVESLPHFVRAVDTVAKQLCNAKAIDSYLYVFVDDGSTDGTPEMIEALSEARDDISGLLFSRNFGKEAALLCGMKEAMALGAQCVAVMDADLQDPPRLLLEMVDRVRDGYDVAAAYRRTREGEPRLRSWFARRFYDLANKICDIEMRNGARDYRLMRREVVEAICAMPERERFSKGLFQWVGYKTAWIGFENVERVAGESSWSFLGLLRYALDGIVSFSSAPLEFISLTGVLLSIVASIGLLVVLVRAIVWSDPVAGWPSLVCIILLLGSLQLMALGVIGMYVAKILSEVKARPAYIVARRVTSRSIQSADFQNVPNSVGIHHD